MTTFKDSLYAIDDEFGICVFGDHQVGKTSLICRYIHQEFIPQLDPAVEELYIKKVLKGNLYEEISILDCSASQDFYASTRKRLIANSGAFIFVYAINDRSSFDLVEDLFERVTHIRRVLPPIALAGLKADLEDERQVDFDEGEQLAQRMNAITFTEACAKTAFGVNELFSPIVNSLAIAKANKSKVVSMSDLNSHLSFHDALSLSPSMNDSQEPETLRNIVLPKKDTTIPIDESLDRSISAFQNDHSKSPTTASDLPNPTEPSKNDTSPSVPKATPSVNEKTASPPKRRSTPSTPNDKAAYGCCCIM